MTDNIYIKMCDHPLIQEQWKLPPRNGDNYYLRNAAYVNHGANTNTYLKAEDVDDATWLPRQGDIQEMMEGTAVELSARFTPAIWADDWSMEQLWLAFYMYEIHGLIWVNGEWENKEEK